MAARRPRCVSDFARNPFVLQAHTQLTGAGFYVFIAGLRY
ncbi:hypothetical protein OROMI_030826 [Orobanche minor]